MKQTINKTHLEGYLYDQDLECKVSGPDSKHPGTEYITGSISIAVDEEGMNVIPVYFRYVTEVTSRGKVNRTFGMLKNIIEGKIGTIMDHGKENAAMLRVNSAVSLREWYNRTEELVSRKCNEGGFIDVVNELPNGDEQRASFNTDIIITRCSRIEPDEEHNIPEKVVVKGAIFDFRGNLLPVEYSAVNEDAMNYFESLEASSKNPIFTRVWGKQVSRTIIQEKVEESAFGAPSITQVKSSYKDFIITHAIPAPYEWDSEDTITVVELKEAMAQRETTLAELLQRCRENNGSSSTKAETTTNNFASVPNKEWRF